MSALRCASILSILLFSFVGTGCPTYDPPEEPIYVDNQTDSTFYVYQSCTDSIEANSGLVLFEHYEFDPENMAAPWHGRETITRAPRYRLSPYDQGELLGLRNGNYVVCADDTARFFFISEGTMRTHSWDEIEREQLYSGKVVATIDDLRASDWTVFYDG